jgi:hypothetical protein
MQLNAVGVAREPCATLYVEPVPRPIVDDEKELLSAISTDEELEEEMKRVPVEDGRELVGEARVVEGDGSENVRGFAKPEGIYSWLDADAAPRLMESAVEPEARLVFEDDDATASASLFLIAGRLVRSHAACFLRSARASRLRGRCTEKPS